jgi:hypothetical protein
MKYLLIFVCLICSVYLPAQEEHDFVYSFNIGYSNLFPSTQTVPLVGSFDFRSRLANNTAYIGGLSFHYNEIDFPSFFLPGRTELATFLNIFVGQRTYMSKPSSKSQLFADLHLGAGLSKLKLNPGTGRPNISEILATIHGGIGFIYNNTIILKPSCTIGWNGDKMLIPYVDFTLGYQFSFRI